MRKEVEKRTKDERADHFWRGLTCSTAGPATIQPSHRTNLVEPMAAPRVTNTVSSSRRVRDVHAISTFFLYSMVWVDPEELRTLNIVH